MKVADFILIIFLSLFSFTSLGYLFINRENQNLEAQIYYKSELIYTIDLTNDVNGDILLEKSKYTELQADMIIEYKLGAIRVEKEESQYNICSKQGWSTSTIEPIICLPNKVYIKLVGKSSVDIVIE